MAKPDAADKRKVFHVGDAALLAAIDLKPTAKAGVSDYSFSDLRPKLTAIGKETERISKIKAADRKPWEHELLTLRNSIVTYERFKNSIQPNSLMQQRARWQPIKYDFAALAGQYHADLQIGVQAAINRIHGGEETLDKAIEERMRLFARPFMGVESAALFAVIPPSDPAGGRETWRNMGAIIVDSARTGALPEPIGHYAVMSSAYAQGRTDIFNNQVARYRAWLLGHRLGPEVSKARSEVLFNVFQPLVRATAIYLVALVLVVLSWLKRSTALYRSALALVLLACALHTTGVLFDMMLQGRPPVTNWYSGIIFAGWAVVLLAGLVEIWGRNGIGLAAGALAGLGAIVAAHSLAPGGGPALLRFAIDIPYVAALTPVLLAAIASHDARPRQVAVVHRVNTPA